MITEDIGLHIKNFTVYSARSLTTVKQKSAIFQFCYQHISNIGSIRRYVTMNAILKLNYRSSLLCALPDTLMTRLQLDWWLILEYDSL